MNIYQKISKQRSTIMGIATILILLFHTSIILPAGIDMIKNWADIGVNLFFFMSGFSMFYSWKKNPNIGRFLKKRLTKIVCTFCPIVFVWCLPQVVIGRISIAEFVEKLLSIRFWIDGNLLYWFVSGIVLLYLITPFWMKLLEYNRKICLGATFIVLIVFVVLAVGEPLHYIAIFVIRMPSYFMGIYGGILCKERKDSGRDIGIMSGMFLLGVVFAIVIYVLQLNFVIRYISYALATPAIISGLAEVFMWMEKKVSLRALSFMGMISLECYLFQERILLVGNTICDKISLDLDAYSVTINITTIALTIIVAYIWHKIIDKILVRVN